MGADAVTSTVCETAATFNAASISATWLMVSVTLVRTTESKPGLLNKMLYSPTLRLGTWYSPTSLVTPVVWILVSMLVAVMLTPGTTAPLESVTVPTIVARSCCAINAAAKVNCSVKPIRINRFIWLPPDLRPDAQVLDFEYYGVDDRINVAIRSPQGIP